MYNPVWNRVSKPQRVASSEARGGDSGNLSQPLATADVRSCAEFGNLAIILGMLAQNQGHGVCFLYLIVSWDSGGNPLDCVVRLF